MWNLQLDFDVDLAKEFLLDDFLKVVNKYRLCSAKETSKRFRTSTTAIASALDSNKTFYGWHVLQLFL